MSSIFFTLCLKFNQLICTTLFCCKTKYSREKKSVKDYFTLFSGFLWTAWIKVWTTKTGVIVHMGCEARCGFWLFVDNVDNEIYLTLGT